MSGPRDIVIAGGTGQIGALLSRAFVGRGDRVTVLSRGREGREGGVEFVRWDGATLGPWASRVDGADVVINLAGRTVNCRYTEENLKQMMDSRVDSTRVIGEAIAAAERPPGVWLQMSTATIYAHRFDAPNGDAGDGIIGGSEPDVPAYWGQSVEIARAWEATLEAAPAPGTRKVAMRTAMVMSPDEGGIFDVLAGLTRRWLGGPMGGGRQYVSWIHGEDLVRAVEFVIASELEGAINFSSPGPLPQRDFQAALREALGVRVGLPAVRWMLEIGAFFMRTDTELLLKSRRVVPTRLLAAGFRFLHPSWPEAAAGLAVGWRTRRGARRLAAS